MIDVDTLRADALGTYGAPAGTTPAIDRFATESCVFEWAFAQAPNTPPSQASILTGLYPSTHGRVENRDPLVEAATTIAEALAPAGYRSAAFVDGGFMRAGFGLEQGFGVWDDSKGRGLAEIGPKALRWMEENRGEPFLALLHTYDVHSPYAPREPFRSLALGATQPPASGFEPTSEALELVRQSQGTPAPKRLSPEELAYARALYQGEVRQLDAWFQGFLDRLRELGLYDRAILVLISDHGEEFQEHGSVLHEKLYATVTRIPWLIRFPGGALRAHVPGVVQSVDLLPTLTESVAAATPAAVQGRSRLPACADPASLHRTVAYSESPFFGEERGLVLGDWRLHLRRQSGAAELYLVRTDPLEQRDLAGNHGDVVDSLKRLLSRMEASNRRLSEKAPAPIEFTEEDLAQLRALGYLDP